MHTNIQANSKDMKPKSLPQKYRIKIQIKNLFSMLYPGDQLRTDDVIKYIKRGLGKQFYPDSGIRYMREMRKDGEINYTCINKQSRTIKVIAIGEPHSL